MLRDSYGALTLKLQGSRSTLAPVRVTFLVRGIPQLPKLAAEFRILNALLQSPRHRVHRSRECLLNRDALVALDGRRVGASHRETAEVIFGIKRVREEWSGRGGWLKERMRRALAKGQELCGGGYRRSLEGPCRLNS